MKKLSLCLLLIVCPVCQQAEAVRQKTLMASMAGAGAIILFLGGYISFSHWPESHPDRPHDKGKISPLLSYRIERTDDDPEFDEWVLAPEVTRGSAAVLDTQADSKALSDFHNISSYRFPVCFTCTAATENTMWSPLVPVMAMCGR